jgi:hypothetical protein
MIDEDAALILAHYRSTSTDQPTPDLDAVILEAANRHTVHRRIIRRTTVGFALVAAIVVPFLGMLLLHAPQASATSDYGRQEGSTRYYLLTGSGAPFTGPGSTEQKQ